MICLNWNDVILDSKCLHGGYHGLRRDVEQHLIEKVKNIINVNGRNRLSIRAMITIY